MQPTQVWSRRGSFVVFAAPTTRVTSAMVSLVSVVAKTMVVGLSSVARPCIRALAAGMVAVAHLDGGRGAFTMDGTAVHFVDHTTQAPFVRTTSAFIVVMIMVIMLSATPGTTTGIGVKISQLQAWYLY